MCSNSKIIIASYNKAAKHYLKMRTNPDVDIFQREQKAICELLPDVSGCRILDLGCGPGVHMAMLAKHGAHVYGVDLSSRMIEHAKPFLRTYETQSSLVMADAISLPFKSSCFEGVLASFLLENLPDIDRALTEIARVTKSYGFMLYSVNHPFLTSILKIEVMDDKSLRLIPGDYFHKSKFDVRLALSRNCSINLHLYHRTLARYLNSIVASGASIECVFEPEPFFNQHSVCNELAGFPLIMVIKCIKG